MSSTTQVKNENVSWALDFLCFFVVKRGVDWFPPIGLVSHYSHFSQKSIHTYIFYSHSHFSHYRQSNTLIHTFHTIHTLFTQIRSKINRVEDTFLLITVIGDWKCFLVPWLHDNFTQNRRFSRTLLVHGAMLGTLYR